jgi:hypothetical protein
MDLRVLSRKINSYRTPKGRMTKLPDKLLGEFFTPGNSGLDHQQDFI